MNIDLLDYDLPSELIATRPVEPRDSARMLVVRCGAGSIEHACVSDLPAFLQSGDLLVRNDTSVIAARLVGRRVVRVGARGSEVGGGRVDGLYLRSVGEDWLAMLTASCRLAVGERVELESPDGEVIGVELREKVGHAWRIRPECTDTAASVLVSLGRTPLPPYILKARSRRGEEIDESDDRRWYRTTFANPSQFGSVAAPTAGLHFTDTIREKLRAEGIAETAVTLHVGEGTFRPVTASRLEDHDMHSETWSIDADAAKMLREGPGEGGRVVAVGTTTTRLLESLPDTLAEGPLAGSTELLISPGWSFRRVEGMVTNFHLPRSTLLALVGAKMGIEFMHEAYRVAVAERYRFYSYGDAMLILP
ncbi:MAG: tRNA preQ1(34) S-adenosylmethionine ribosyltransferase-isomerase QueA [Phycisphaerales bacterium]|nr:tRNA preQ1(34) S-adenosylmethionine ribosyltransferase-isomerase QueA [Phycisphaerales bacterium]